MNSMNIEAYFYHLSKACLQHFLNLSIVVKVLWIFIIVRFCGLGSLTIGCYSGFLCLCVLLSFFLHIRHVYFLSLKSGGGWSNALPLVKGMACLQKYDKCTHVYDECKSKTDNIYDILSVIKIKKKTYRKIIGHFLQGRERERTYLTRIKKTKLSIKADLENQNESVNSSSYI